jgi:hypothetical protein
VGIFDESGAVIAIGQADAGRREVRPVKVLA